MARGRRSAAPRARAPAPQAHRPAPTSAPVQAKPPAPMQQSSGGGMLSGIGSTIAQGMAFGTGSAIAHRAVGAVAGSFAGDSNEAAPPTTAPEQQYDTMQSSNACVDEKKMFYECLSTNKGDQEACAFLYDIVKDCNRNAQMYS